MAVMARAREPASSLRSALLVAVPEASTVAEPWLERTANAKPSHGVPAHVTVLFPFVPAAELDHALLESLSAIFVRMQPFDFELAACRRFPAVLYLAPEPAEPFVAMTDAVVAAYPDFPPYEGVFDSIVPHLTVAEGLPTVLNRAEGEVRPQLPIRAEARDVLLLEEIDTTSWRPRARIPLGTT
jgi:2'-5' RNA ligase